MHVFNRTFVALLALGWCALLGATLLLVWDEARVVDINNSVFQAGFDVTLADQSDRILATIGIGALIAVGVLLFAVQLVPRGGRTVVRDDSRINEMQRRVDALQNQVENERVHSERKVVTQEIPVHDGDTVTKKESVVREDGRPRRWRFLPGR